MSFGKFADFLDASLNLLRRETPPAVRRIAERLDGRAVHFEVESSAFVLRVEQNRHQVEAFTHDCSVFLGLDHDIVLDLVEGRLSLLEAVLDDRLRPRGRPAELVCFFEALRAYLEGAVRAPSMPRLYHAYRSGEPTPSDV